jgi:hypothetical protein
MSYLCHIQSTQKKGIKLWNPIMSFLVHFSSQMYPKIVNLNEIIFYLSNEKVMSSYMCHL